MHLNLNSTATTIHPLSIFFSYSHKDERLRNDLERHLGILKKNEEITCWYDRKIGPGQEWKGEIDKHLEAADIVLLLISADFAASDYCWDVEMKRAIERHENGETTVIPILLRPVAGWQKAPFGKFQIFPQNGKAVTEWKNRDKAFEDVANGIERILKEKSNEALKTSKKMVEWILRVEGSFEDFPESRISDITLDLRKLSEDISVILIEKVSGSIQLKFRSSRLGYDVLRKYKDDGSLTTKLGIPVLDLSEPIGATIHIESREIDPAARPSVTPSTDIFTDNQVKKGFPPLVGGITFPLDNPINVGFTLYTDSSKKPSEQELTQLQARLGRYFTTFLVVRGEDIHVNLSPLEEYGGLPEPLCRTELGRDMLAQDLVLKRYTASLVHPVTEFGKAFWEELQKSGNLQQPLESCLRVWIVPGDATVEEKTIGNQGHVALKKFNPQVLCESDYLSLQYLKKSRVEQNESPVTGNTRVDDHILSVFKRLILPKIQEEVSTGTSFGVFRQILSVCIMAKWFRDKLGQHMKGFLDSNQTGKYDLDIVGDEPLLIQKEYLRIFKEGVWRYVHKFFDLEKGHTINRLYVAGGITVK